MISYLLAVVLIAAPESAIHETLPQCRPCCCQNQEKSDSLAHQTCDPSGRFVQSFGRSADFPRDERFPGAGQLSDTMLRSRGDELEVVATRSVADALHMLSVIRFRKDIILSNLANIHSHGYKRLDPWTMAREFSQGFFRNTENQFHIAIEGDGFFELLLPNGASAYTRNGAFERDSRGNVVTSQGFLLQPQFIVNPEAINLEINAEGIVTEQLPDGTLQQIGQIQLTKFINPAGLYTSTYSTIHPSVIWRETASSGVPTTGPPGENGTGLLRQGYVELSNVNIINEEAHLEMLRLHDEALRFGLSSVGYNLRKH